MENGSHRAVIHTVSEEFAESRSHRVILPGSCPLSAMGCPPRSLPKPPSSQSAAPPWSSPAAAGTPRATAPIRDQRLGLQASRARTVRMPVALRGILPSFPPKCRSRMIDFCNARSPQPGWWLAGEATCRTGPGPAVCSGVVGWCRVGGAISGRRCLHPGVIFRALVRPTLRQPTNQPTTPPASKPTPRPRGGSSPISGQRCPPLRTRDVQGGIIINHTYVVWSGIEVALLRGEEWRMPRGPSI